LITYIEVPPEIEKLDSQSKTICEQMFHLITGRGSTMQCNNGFDLLSLPGNALVQIKQGIFKYYYNNKLVRLYESRDCIPLFDQPPTSDCRCVSEFGADITIFALDNIDISPAFSTLFMLFVSIQSRLMHILCASYINDEAQPNFTIQRFDVGATIIAEGTPAHEIYMMIQGTAVVTVKNVKVGVIEPGEVFGEISFFTAGMRSATVTAKTECLVQVMRKEGFLALVQLKPSVNLEITKTLSQRLIETNRQIAD
jgi:CRP/FNR family transcriptional regulator, cyclic AMP receptor protein